MHNGYLLLWTHHNICFVSMEVGLGLWIIWYITQLKPGFSSFDYFSIISAIRINISFEFIYDILQIESLQGFKCQKIMTNLCK